MKFDVLLIFFLINCYKVWWCLADANNLNLPQIQKQNEHKSEDNKEQTFSLNIPNSQRTEIIFRDPADGQLSVGGTISTYYPDIMQTLIVNYGADKNGYRASYKIMKSSPPSGPLFHTRLSANTLKSTVG